MDYGGKNAIGRWGAGWRRACLVAAITLGLAPAAGASDDFGDRVRDYLLANPEVILEAMEVLAARQAEAEGMALISAHAAPAFDPSRAVILGDPAAPYKIVELFDYRCISCKAAHPVLEAFVAERTDVAILIQQLPILGPQSDRASRAFLATFELYGRAAAEALHAALFTLPGPISGAVLEAVLTELGHDAGAVETAMYGAAVTQRVNEMKDMALNLGVVGTPVFLTERTLHQGVATRDLLQSFVAELAG